MSESRQSLVIPAWIVLIVFVFVAFGIEYFYVHQCLRAVPGPFIAKFTNLWRYLDVRKGAHQETLIRLHQKYGPIVRTGPNVVSIADHDAIAQIYGVGKGFVKVQTPYILEASILMLLPETRELSTIVFSNTVEGGSYQRCSQRKTRHFIKPSGGRSLAHML